MSDNSFGSKPYESPEQVWVAAGWLVLVLSNEQGEVKRTFACHYATGKILTINMNYSMNEPWEIQTIHKITEYK